MIGMSYPLWKLPPWFGGQIGIQGSESALGFRMEPQGVVFYVDGGSPTANDNNDGTDPRYPKATIQAAITAHNATLNWAATPPYAGINLIVVAPGEYDENLTPPYYCKVLGLGNCQGGDWSVHVNPTAGSALTGTGNYTWWENIRFDCNTAAPVFDLDVANSMVVERCAIISGNGGLATYGIDIEEAGGSRFIDNCFGHTATPFTQAAFRCQGNFFDCVIAGNRMQADLIGIDLSAAGLHGNTVIDHNYIHNCADGIDCGAHTEPFVVDNFIMCTNAAGPGAGAIIHGDVNMLIANRTIAGGVAAIVTAGTT